jgi:hypothetical protein
MKLNARADQGFGLWAQGFGVNGSCPPARADQVTFYPNIHSGKKKLKLTLALTFLFEGWLNRLPGSAIT